MKILAVSDDEMPVLGEASKREKIGPVDLIISCGDLNPDYLSYLATVSEYRSFMCAAIMIKKSAPPPSWEKTYITAS